MTVVGDGSVQLAALAARLKVAGASGLRLELLRSLKKIPAPLIADVRTAARENLPKAGGLNERVAESAIKTQVRTSGRNASVRIVATEHDARTSNFGGVRHPVFGNRAVWVSQDIPAARGWFTDTLAGKGDDVTRELLDAMERVSRAIQVGL